MDCKCDYCDHRNSNYKRFRISDMDYDDPFSNFNLDSMKNLFQGDRYMFDPYEWKSKIYLHPLNKMNDLYYKVCCYWNAKTEMYDSILADGFTYFNEAYILNSKLRGYSAEYSRQIFLFCQHVLICECDKPFDENLWKNINNNRHTARQWMKEYERLKSNGELDFIKKYKR